MPTKTDRILDLLPRTFRALPRPTALYSVADAFGNELQSAENSLAALMRAHWVDHADLGAESIDDLARIASLYGLSPRADEGVEQFRSRLKRFIRIFLEGPSTVQGILRIAAEALDVAILDDVDELDSWWRRESESLTTAVPLGADAAELVLGVPAANLAGRSDRPAEVVGDADLSAGAQFESEHFLRLQIDGGDILEIPFQGPFSLPEIVEAIDAAAGGKVARAEGRFLALASPSAGGDSRLRLPDAEADAAERLLGLLPRTYRGREATSAELTGEADLTGGVDLSEERFLRILVDGSHFEEIDCAGPVPEATSLDQIRDAINSGLGVEVARHDGRFLTIESPTQGFSSLISLQQAAAQDARRRLFGSVTFTRSGRDALPAEVTGRVDVSDGADLSESSRLELSVDGGAAVSLDAAGASPAATRPVEIVEAINSALGAQIARHDGRFITVTSPSVGNASGIVFGKPDGDAAEAIFGIRPRSFKGAAATTARLEGTSDLASGANLWAQHLLRLTVDGKSRIVDLSKQAGDRANVSLDEMRDAINQAFGFQVASHDGRFPTLSSPTPGPQGILGIEPLQAVSRRRFVTRGIIGQEAAMKILGFAERTAQGSAADPARLAGTADLSRSVDLSEARFLSLSVDGSPARDVDCAGPRPRATLLHEVVEAVNKVFQDQTEPVADSDGQHLVLTSPGRGASSSLALQQPRATDALDLLLGVEPGLSRGQDATTVRFVSTKDLSQGADLPANAALKLGIDGEEPVEIPLAGANPQHKTLSQLVVAINTALQSGVASHDGRRLALSLARNGSMRALAISIPDGHDATQDILGIAAPRFYRGSDALPAQVRGRRDLSGGADLRVSRFLVLSVDGQAAVTVDCAANASDESAVSVTKIVAAINEALGGELVASQEGSRLVLTSIRAGFAGRIALERHSTPDAREKLLGPDVPDSVEGSDASPAVITGESTGPSPIDLSQRSLLRVSVDGAHPVDIDVAGPDPSASFLDEIAESINQRLPALASVTDDFRLRLVSPVSGETSRLSVLSLRQIELIEYPPAPARSDFGPVKHGQRLTLRNRGAADVFAEVELKAPQGVFGAMLVNLAIERQVRVLSVAEPGETLRVKAGESATRIEAQIVGEDGEKRPVPPGQVLAGATGAHVQVPFQGARRLSQGSAGRALQLDDPSSEFVLRLRSKRVEGAQITVRVEESEASPDPQSGVRLFDVSIEQDSDDAPVSERYDGVSIGAKGRTNDLVQRVNSPGAPSQLVVAEQLEESEALSLPAGKSEWIYAECDADRFDRSRFDEARFAGPPCRENGIFDVSPFAEEAPKEIAAVFADGREAPSARLSATWPEHAPGRFVVNLPADLAPRFGGRFNEARFGLGEQPETFERVVTEPAEDPDFLASVLNQGRDGEETSALVAAEVVARVPPGFQRVEIPFREPRFLQAGREGEAASLYLAEEGLQGIIRIRARQEGEWGNRISISVRSSGPAMFDLSVSFSGDRFENARRQILGKEPPQDNPDLPVAASELLRPGPVGILTAKAAGVHAQATRERAGPEPLRPPKNKENENGQQ